MKSVFPAGFRLDASLMSVTETLQSLYNVYVLHHDIVYDCVGCMHDCAIPAYY